MERADELALYVSKGYSNWGLAREKRKQKRQTRSAQGSFQFSEVSHDKTSLFVKGRRLAHSAVHRFAMVLIS